MFSKRCTLFQYSSNQQGLILLFIILLLKNLLCKQNYKTENSEFNATSDKAVTMFKKNSPQLHNKERLASI
jgi:hypothetical protein